MLVNFECYLNPAIATCSAGVGRTGTLITVDVELQRAQKEGVVDPFDYVLQMRQQRNHMVQTEVCTYYHDTPFSFVSYI